MIEGSGSVPLINRSVSAILDRIQPDSIVAGTIFNTYRRKQVFETM